MNRNQQPQDEQSGEQRSSTRRQGNASQPSRPSTPIGSRSSSSSSLSSVDTGSSLGVYPSRAQDNERKRVQAEAAKLGIPPELVSTFHHTVPRHTPQGASIQGSRSSGDWGPPPQQRGDDPQKGNPLSSAPDVQTRHTKHGDKPTARTSAAMRAAENPTPGNLGAMRAAKPTPRQQAQQARNGFVKDRKGNWVRQPLGQPGQKPQKNYANTNEGCKPNSISGPGHQPPPSGGG